MEEQQNIHLVLCHLCSMRSAITGWWRTLGREGGRRKISMSNLAIFLVGMSSRSFSRRSEEGAGERREPKSALT